MLSSMFALLAVTAVVLLVPAFAALLAVERRRHVAAAQDTRRRVRVVVAATGVALASLGVAALLRAEVVAAVVVAVVLAGSVLVWAPMSRSWAVRGVVMWSLLVTAAVAVLGWLVQQMVAASMSGTEIAVTATVTLVLLLSLARGQGYVRDVIGAQAGTGPRTPTRQRIPVLRPFVSLVALLAAGGVVLAVTSGDTGQDGSGSPEAARSGLGGVPSPPQPSTASTPTLSGSPSDVERTSAARPHEGPGGAVGASGTRAVERLQPNAVLRTAAPSTAAGSPRAVAQRSGTDRAAAPVPAAPKSGDRPARPALPTPSTNPWEGVDWSDLPGEPSGRPTPHPQPPPAPADPPPPTRPGPPRPVPPVPAPGLVGKTPGYAKAKANRPLHAPTPGHGRQHMQHQPFPPYGHGRQHMQHQPFPPYATVPRHPVR